MVPVVGARRSSREAVDRLRIAGVLLRARAPRADAAAPLGAQPPALPHGAARSASPRSTRRAPPIPRSTTSPTRSHQLLRRRGHARRSREPAPEGASQRAARRPRAHDVAPRGADAALRGPRSRTASSPSARGATCSPFAPTRTSAFPASCTGASGSGGTLFVEPRAVVPMGNRLKVLEGEVAREEEAIYAKLSAQLCSHLPSVLGAADAMSRARRVRGDRAPRRRATACIFQTSSDAPRHEPEARAAPAPRARAAGRRRERPRASSRRARVVLSGPNAGGKTVALKTLGLCALLVRAGLPLPCDEDSDVGHLPRRPHRRRRRSEPAEEPLDVQRARAERRGDPRRARTRARSCCSTSSRAAPIRAKARRSPRACSTRSCSQGGGGRRDDALRRSQGARARRSRASRTRASVSTSRR